MNTTTPIAPPPSATLISATAQTGTCTGPSGRHYVFKRLRPLDRMLISKAVGGELMLNPIYSSYALIACSINSIDEQSVAMPSTTRQVEAMVQRIGEDWDQINISMGLAFAPTVDTGIQDDAA